MNAEEILQADVRQALTELSGEADLAPHVAKRVRALLRDLTQNDLEMAMLDLAQLSRAVMAGQEPPPNSADLSGPVAILEEDNDALRGLCYGPAEDGRCPWAGRDGALPCDGAWLSAAGWQFKVAEDANEMCPLSVLMAKAG